MDESCVVNLERVLHSDSRLFALRAPVLGRHFTETEGIFYA